MAEHAEGLICGVLLAQWGVVRIGDSQWLRLRNPRPPQPTRPRASLRHSRAYREHLPGPLLRPRRAALRPERRAPPGRVDRAGRRSPSAARRRRQRPLPPPQPVGPAPHPHRDSTRLPGRRGPRLSPAQRGILPARIRRDLSAASLKPPRRLPARSRSPIAARSRSTNCATSIPRNSPRPAKRRCRTSRG